MLKHRQQHPEAIPNESHNWQNQLLEWYSTTIASQTAQKCLEGLSEKQLVKIAGPFNNRGHQVWETYQVSCFGWIVDRVSAQAVAFGSDPYYLSMKEDNPLQMRDQCVDYGTMIHVQLMRKKQGTLLDPRKQKIINNNITQMKWGSTFTDMCYWEKIKLVNYPRGLKAIGAPGGLQAFWQQEARETSWEAVEDEDEGMAPLWDDDSDKGSTSKCMVLLEEDLVRFVPWDENEKALSVPDRANIGIVTQQPRGDEEPLVLTKVLHSRKYVEYARARSTKMVGREDSDEEDSDSESDAPRKSCKMKVSKSNAVRQERVQEEESNSDTSVAAVPQKKKTVAPRQDAEHNSDSAPVEPTRKKKTVSAPAEPAKKKKTVAPRRDAEVNSDSACEEEEDCGTLLRLPTWLPKKIAGKGRDEVGLVQKAHIEMQEMDEDEEWPRKQAQLNRENGKKHGKEKNIADQREVVGGQGRKRKRDQEAPRVIAQLSRPIAKLPKRRSDD
ncbi:hypothetical protein BT96DRAFT_948352 [Gymnopus androsaceus JB14]|uniref:Uncharacterized protein n=1 Tax=Gymnopus androsaceus JB14 TaxID=1447944 RepID=A0A6A4GNU2_9AGAR|nr:hypothetical protein BT96DRAFT_948352 [Gymnopus androsaceus JB14]